MAILQDFGSVFYFASAHFILLKKHFYYTVPFAGADLKGKGDVKIGYGLWVMGE